jgi:hypothetical protein
MGEELREQVTELLGEPNEAVVDALLVYATNKVAHVAGAALNARWRAEDELTEARGELGRLRNRITALEANGSELLARGEQLAAERCPSCDHLAGHHQPEGCWYAITTSEPGRDLVCPCIVPYAPESNADAPSPVTAATEAHGETTEAQEGPR